MNLLNLAPDIQETIGVSDRMLVLYRGSILKELTRGEATKADVMFWISGGREAHAEVAS